MPKPHIPPKPPYSAQFREQMVELVQTGRNPNELAREFGCHVTSILSWMRKARLNLPAGSVPPELPLGASERQELVELCRKVRQLQMERDILSTADPSLQAEASRRSQRLHADPSPGLRAGTTPGGFIRHWTTCRPITLRGNTVNKNHHRQNHQNNRRPKTAYPPRASHLWTRRFRA